MNIIQLLELRRVIKINAEVICEEYIDYCPDMIAFWTEKYLKEDYEVHNGFIFYLYKDEEVEAEYLVRIDDVVNKMISYASRGYDELNKDVIRVAIEECAWDEISRQNK